MDSLQPILPDQGIHLYGVNGSGDGQAQNQNQEPKALERIEILDEQIIQKSGCFERGRRWLRGRHPKLGTIVWGLTGWETMQEFDRIRPLHTFTVIDPNLHEQSGMSQNPHDESKTHTLGNPPPQSSGDGGAGSHETPSPVA